MNDVRDSVSHAQALFLMSLGLGMAWCVRNRLKRRKIVHGKEKHMELEEGAR